MNSITKEQLREYAEKKVKSLKFAITQSVFTGITEGLEKELQLAEFALAAMDAEPVSETYKLPPNSFTNEDLGGMAHGNNPVANAYRELLALRRNSPAIPDGWVMVPVEPTESMIVEGFESVPHEGFSAQDVWEKYQAMSGCEQAAHRAKLCWAAMLAAAQKQDKKA